ncbi:MAG: response regulator transcription factor [Ignavibacteria bacterium]|nr:response regulator transcription factor [Ignavibacteria bacterium]
MLLLLELSQMVKPKMPILILNINTVNTYRARIMEKMEMHSNMELAHYAIENKLID